MKQKIEAKEEEDAGKSDVQKQIDDAVSKAEAEGKMPSEQEVKKVENAVRVAAAENDKLSERNSDPE